MPGLNEISKRLSTSALKDDSLKYYVNLEPGRGDDPIKPIKRKLYDNPKGKEQILFSGYRGCGKSTELNKLQTEISNDFIIVNFSVLKELDSINLNYTELFIIMMEKLFSVVSENEVPISEEFLKSILAWTNSEDLETVRKYGGELNIETGAEVKVNLLSFFKFFANLRAAANVSHTVKRTIKDNIEKRLSDLINNCNDFIREIHQNSPKGLLIIVEDLDKILVEKAKELFFTYGHIITSLNVHIIFTYPIALKYSQQSIIIKANFTQDFELPMVKIKTKQGLNFDSGRNALHTIITKRIETKYFEDPSLIFDIIDKSGGCLWDIFRMAGSAIDYTLNNERELITEPDFRKGYYKLKRDYEATIAEKRDTYGVITVDKYYEKLVKLAKDDNKKVDNDAPDLDLRQNLCILGYNDEGWCDVHPIVRDILIERKLID